jgi:phosphinothricin acetyltransferase
VARAEIRPARESDLRRLTEIYNHYIEHTHITFDTEVLSIEDRRAWFSRFAATGSHYLLVVCSDSSLVGYACSGQFRAKRAYARSVETSIYLDPAARSSGLGPPLYSELLGKLEAESEFHRAYGGIALPNQASIGLHRGLGFASVGTFKEVGFKFGRYWDVEWFERAL